jgi:peptide chain release factor 2
MDEIKDRLRELKTRLEALQSKLDINEKIKSLRQLEADSMKGDFWTDVKSAQNTMQKISLLRGEIDELGNIESTFANLQELTTLPAEDSSDLNLEREVERLTAQIDQAEERLFLAGPYDQNNAFLAVHAGQGGVEAMDWAAMLARMFERFAESKGWSVALVDETKGEEAGIKSSTFEIKGPLAYGLLKNESGTHRLVRQSPFNADNLRQTSFALVEVLPVVESSTEVNINEADLEYDMFRSSGPGGQNVQKVSTAVRIKHLPTGIVVTCQSERSQHQNKENALKLLAGKLAQIEEAKRRENEKDLKTWQKTASWGTQIRSYVLHPYKLVKDLRTQVETSDTEGVLNGKLDQFIEAEIRL